jgi:hypothetical protein
MEVIGRLQATVILPTGRDTVASLGGSQNHVSYIVTLSFIHSGQCKKISRNTNYKLFKACATKNV